MNLCNRPPYAKGQPQPEKPRRRLPPVSPKRRAVKSAEKAGGAWRHMAAVKAMPCIACGAAGPSEAHHVTGDGRRRSDWRVIPLCAPCHRGPDGYHLNKRSWVARHGRDCDFLPQVAAMLGGGVVPRWKE